METTILKPGSKISTKPITSDKDILSFMHQIMDDSRITDVKKPLNMDQLRAEYRSHKINLDSPIQRYVIPGPLYRFYVPVIIRKTMQAPFLISRSYEFYVPVRAEDVEMAVSLAISIVKYKWLTPKHSVITSINGTIRF